MGVAFVVELEKFQELFSSSSFCWWTSVYLFFKVHMVQYLYAAYASWYNYYLFIIYIYYVYKIYFIYFYAVSVCLECTHPQGILVAACKPNWLRLVYTLYIFMQYLFVWSALTHRVYLLLHVSPIG